MHPGTSRVKSNFAVKVIGHRDRHCRQLLLLDYLGGPGIRRAVADIRLTEVDHKAKYRRAAAPLFQ